MIAVMLTRAEKPAKRCSVQSLLPSLQRSERQKAGKVSNVPVMRTTLSLSSAVCSSKRVFGTTSMLTEH